ncbi:MAG: hypothetical protein AAF356_02485 [Planctomycetota bacterium]
MGKIEIDFTIDWAEIQDFADERSVVSRLFSALGGGTWREDDVDDQWSDRMVLYAYVDPDDGELLYLGKAAAQSVRSRFDAKEKDRVWDFIHRERGLTPESAVIIVGHPQARKGRRLDKVALAYLERLLIWKFEPLANIANMTSYKGRDDTVILCTGDWPSPFRIIVDDAHL